MRGEIIVVSALILVLLTSVSVNAQPTEAPQADGADSQTNKDWTYYFQLPFSLILIFILIVGMMVYVRKVSE